MSGWIGGGIHWSLRFLWLYFSSCSLRPAQKIAKRLAFLAVCHCSANVQIYLVTWNSFCNLAFCFVSRLVRINLSYFYISMNLNFSNQLYLQHSLFPKENRFDVSVNDCSPYGVVQVIDHFSDIGSCVNRHCDVL